MTRKPRRSELMRRQADALLKLKRASGRFSLPGMIAVVLIGLVAGLGLGAIVCAVQRLLPFSIPIILPGIIGGLAGVVVWRLGVSIGRCRNPALAIVVAIIVGVFAWESSHLVDYAWFRWDAQAALALQAPESTAAARDRAIDSYLKDETGLTGFGGYLVAKIQNSEVAFYHFFSGSAVPSGTASGPMLLFWWMLDAILAGTLAVVINKDYASDLYCDACNEWGKARTPVVGTDARLDDVIDSLRMGQAQAACDALERSEEGHITRLQVEYCPRCYQSNPTHLVVVHDTGPRTWEEVTVWTGDLPPQAMTHIAQRGTA